MSDRGPGIPAAEREAIFRAYARLQAPTARTRGSYGLGLAFCQLASNALGGRIWVEPGDPTGSVFCVDIPIPPA